MSNQPFSLDDYLRQVREAEERAAPRDETAAEDDKSVSTPLGVADASPAEEAAQQPEPEPLVIEDGNRSNGSDAAALPPVLEAEEGLVGPAVLDNVEPEILPRIEGQGASTEEVALTTPTALIEPETPPAREVPELPSAPEIEEPSDQIEARPVRPTPGNWHIRERDTGALTTRTMYPTLDAWLAENTLSYDTLVTVALAPNLDKGIPDRLSNALTQAAYALGQNAPFLILLPAASNAVLLGSDGSDDPPYGLQDLVPVVFGIYRDIRAAFVAYQARYPTRLALSSGERVEGFGEVLLWKLKDALNGAKIGMPDLMKDIEVADILAAAIESTLKDVFAGLAPRDEIGRALQDPVRMSHARAAWAEFLTRISGT